MHMTSFGGRRLSVTFDDGSEKGRRFGLSNINDEALAEDLVEVAQAISDILGDDVLLDVISDTSTLNYRV